MRSLALVFLVVLTVGCEKQEAPTAPSSAGVWIFGRVLDFATDVGVSGATVALGNATAVTDTAGRYKLEVPAIGTYRSVVDGVEVGSSHVTGSSYRGDFLVRPGECASRYGTLTDVQTRAPIAGARVSWLDGNAISEIDGWYRVDLGGCPPTSLNRFNTVVFSVSHPNYVDPYRLSRFAVIRDALRFDLELQRR